MENAAIGFRFLVGFVFLLAGLSKLPRRPDFEQTIRGYELVSRRIAHLIADWLPRLEITGGLLLILGVATAPTAFLMSALLVVFAGAVFINLARGREIDCGCFSSTAPEQIGWSVVMRNLGLAAVAAVAAYETPRTLSLVPVFGGTTSAVSAGDALAFGVAAAAVAVGWLLATEVSQVWERREHYVRRLEA